MRNDVGPRADCLPQVPLVRHTSDVSSHESSHLTHGSGANAMTIDVEEHFQVHAFADIISRDTWTQHPSRVTQNTQQILNLLDEGQQKATFFVLGCVAENHPALIRRIVDGGHELASHGYAHIRVDRQHPEEFRADVRRTKNVLEEIGQAPVRGYRAASFSIGRDQFWAHRVLAEEGYVYSSSIYPVQHDHYGYPEAPRFSFRPLGDTGVVEIPLSTHTLLGRNMPAAGGGYFRLLPYTLSRWQVRRVTHSEGRPVIFYLHPWEIDPDQPRQLGVSLKSGFRHYVNLNRTAGRLRRLLSDFRWDRMDRVFAGDIHARDGS